MAYHLQFMDMRSITSCDKISSFDAQFLKAKILYAYKSVAVLRINSQLNVNHFEKKTIMGLDF